MTEKFVRRWQLLAEGFTANDLRQLTEYGALDGEVCYLVEEVRDKLGHDCVGEDN